MGKYSEEINDVKNETIDVINNMDIPDDIKEALKEGYDIDHKTGFVKCNIEVLAIIVLIIMKYSCR